MSVSVAIVGGGPAGLTAAAALAPHVPGDVVVIEREDETGGIPRHCHHPGFGVRDQRRFLTGPSYARRLTALARDSGASLETNAMVTGWADDHTLEITSPRGRRTLRAGAIVLATGARERPRPARLIPGDRPDGVYTTGQLQRLVHLRLPVGRRAVVLGTDLVSLSAVLTLRRSGCRTVRMVSRLLSINGRTRVTSVDVEDRRTGRRERIDCDTVVVTGDWIPDHEVARTGGLAVDPGTRGPRVDAALATSRPGIFAAGNLLHPVDTADVAALDGRHVARAVLAHLAGELPPPGAVEVGVAPPLRWIAPQLLHPGGPPPARGRLLLWCDIHRALPRLEATQDGTRIGAMRLLRPATPGRVLRVPAQLVARARPGGGPVRITLAG